MKGFPNKVSGYPHPLSKTLQNGQPSKVHAILLAWHAEMRKKGEPSSLFPSPCLRAPPPRLCRLQRINRSAPLSGGAERDEHKFLFGGWDG